MGSPTPAATATLTNIDDAEWLRFLGRCREATFFHTPLWTHLLADCYGFAPRALIWRTPSREIIGGLPLCEIRSVTGRRRWVALPFSDHCRVLALDARTPGFVESAAAELARCASASLEVRSWLPDGSGAHQVLTAVRHSIDLGPGAASILAGMSRMHRGSIRKAERTSIAVRRGTSIEAMQVFYNLHLRTRRRLGLPVQPMRFFRLIVERVLHSGKGFILIATIGGEAVAAGLFVTSGEALLFKYAASDNARREGRPNHLLAWTAIQIACEEGFLSFDWGRTDMANAGLRKYKIAYGAVEEPLPYSWIGEIPHAAHPAVRERMGALIRRSPLWVCRLSGELFYRYAS